MLCLLDQSLRVEGIAVIDAKNGDDGTVRYQIKVSGSNFPFVCLFYLGGDSLKLKWWMTLVHVQQLWPA